MKVAILYNKFFDHDGREQLIGGVETYLLNLAMVCQEMGMETTIYQWSNQPFEKSVNGLNVKGVPVCHLPFKKRNAALFELVTAEIDGNKDILIFGADHKSVPTHNPRHISIQHGIAWDLPAQHLTQRDIVKYKWVAGIIKWRVIRSCKRSFENCHNTVCVDYNFLNWYRTTVTEEPKGHNIWVIPNFTPIASVERINARDRDDKIIRILFARRFTEFRGTRIMAEAAREILARNSNAEFTFAGEGPDENWLKKYFGDEARVKITKYFPQKVMDVHLKHHIAVIPSIASEGTSLSVAEAMGCGCAIVATPVGGITNMIIDGYNGLLILPEVHAFSSAIEQVIADPALRRRLSKRAYDTANNAFSLSTWKQKWRAVLQDVCK